MQTHEKITLAKNVTRIVVGHSVGFVVATSIRTLVAPQTRTQQVQMMIGGYAIGAAISDRVMSGFDEKWENAEAKVRSLKHKIENP